MIDLSQSEFEQKVRSRLNELAGKAAAGLHEGHAKDFSDYKYLLGLLHGFSQVNAVLDDVSNGIMRGDQDGSVN